MIPYSLLDNAWGSLAGDQLSGTNCSGSVVGDQLLGISCRRLIVRRSVVGDQLSGIICRESVVWGSVVGQPYNPSLEHRSLSRSASQ